MAAESSTARSGPSKKEVDVQDLLKNLKLHESELQDVVLGKEEMKGWPEVKWLAAAKVLTEKSFSLESLKRTMHSAWTPAREVTFHPVGAGFVQLPGLGRSDRKPSFGDDGELGIAMAESSRAREGKSRKDVDADELLRNVKLHGKKLPRYMSPIEQRKMQMKANAGQSEEVGGKSNAAFGSSAGSLEGCRREQ